MGPFTSGLVGHRGNPGTKGRLLSKSLEAYLLALETINRVTITYRIENFCTLVCNAWELLLKAKVLDDSKSRAAIYYPQKRGEPLRSISLADASTRVFPDDRDRTRRNIERVVELRDAAVHLFISDVPKDVLGLLQACVLNYHRCLNDWFGVVIAERIPLGMMTIVFDVSPETMDLSNTVMRRRLGRDAAEYLTALTDQLRAEHLEHEMSPEFSVQIRYGLVTTKSAKDAAAVAFTDPAGSPAGIIAVPKDPSKGWPWRQKELVAELCRRLGRMVNSYDVQAIVDVNNVKSHPEWFYQGTVTGNPAQYSEALADWITKRVGQDADFIRKCRSKHAERQKRARSA
jgi:hypothetical protein